MNITCPKCRFRHPASRSCEDARRLASEPEKNELRKIDPEHEDTHVVRDARRYRWLRQMPAVQALFEEQFAGGLDALIDEEIRSADEDY